MIDRIVIMWISTTFYDSIVIRMWVSHIEEIKIEWMTALSILEGKCV